MPPETGNWKVIKLIKNCSQELVIYQGLIKLTQAGRLQSVALIRVTTLVTTMKQELWAIQNLQNTTKVKSECRKGPILSHIWIPSQKLRYLDLYITKIWPFLIKIWKKWTGIILELKNFLGFLEPRVCSKALDIPSSIFGLLQFCEIVNLWKYSELLDYLNNSGV